MRVVSGILKGRRIPVAKNFSARPTTDFAKENLFNVLNNFIDFEETSVLDLFSGTGSIAYEFASRGCPKVVCVESNFRHFKFIQETTCKLGLENIVTVLKSDTASYLNSCQLQFDLVFADPPFDMVGIDKLPATILTKQLIKQGGLLILEHPGQYNFAGEPGFRELRKYGSVHFSLFSK